MSVQLISLGVPTPISQGVIYALPSRVASIISDASIEVSQSLSGPWTGLTSGSRSAYSFLRCPSSNTVITAKSNQSIIQSSPPAVSYASKIIADGASYYWRLNETSGTTVVDSIGGVNGTIISGVTLNQPGPLSDPSSKSMLFAGTRGILTSGNVLQPVNSSTEFWANGTSTAAQTVCGSYFADNANGVQFGISAGNASLYLYCDVGLNGPGGPNVMTGSWNHCVCVLTTPNALFYVNGVFVGNIASTRANPSNVIFAIGSMTNGTSSPFSGSISEVAVYPFILTPAQIANHYSLR